MGDMADWFIEQEMNANPHWSFVGRRRIWRQPVQALRAVHTCKNCGQHGLIWSETSGKFTLVNGDFTPHVCNPADVLLHAASDFKDCDD